MRAAISAPATAIASSSAAARGERQRRDVLPRPGPGRSWRAERHPGQRGRGRVRQVRPRRVEQPADERLVITIQAKIPIIAANWERTSDPDRDADRAEQGRAD